MCRAVIEQIGCDKFAKKIQGLPFIEEVWPLPSMYTQQIPEYNPFIQDVINYPLDYS